MKIIFLGIRGIPSNYGGFETCVEEIATRLSHVHEVIVYARKSHYKKRIKNYKNVKIIYLPSINIKVLETLSHTFLSVLHALFFNWNAIWMIFNAANSTMLFLPWLFRRKMAINTDGLEWKRDKWGKFGKFYYQFSEWLSTKFVKNIVTDSNGLNDYYLKRWKKKSTTIEYGAYLYDSKNFSILNDYKIEKNKYFLQITRLEPENNPLLTIESFKEFCKQNPNLNYKLVIIGDVTYESPYSEKVKSLADDNIVLPGYVYNTDILNEIRANCFAYVHGNQVGGTNPALLEAMGCGSYVISRDVKFNREVLGDGGIFYKRTIHDLAKKMKWLHENQEVRVKAIKFSQQRVKEYYNWDRITLEYENLFCEIDNIK